MKTNLLYLVGQLGVGGYERQLYYLLKTMDRERYRPIVVLWSSGTNDYYAPMIDELGVPVVKFPGGASRIEKMRTLRRLIKQLKPEVVHSYSFYTNFSAFLAARGTQTDRKSVV